MLKTKSLSDYFSQVGQLESVAWVAPLPIVSFNFISTTMNTVYSLLIFFAGQLKSLVGWSNIHPKWKRVHLVSSIAKIDIKKSPTVVNCICIKFAPKHCWHWCERLRCIWHVLASAFRRKLKPTLMLIPNSDLSIQTMASAVLPQTAPYWPFHFANWIINRCCKRRSRRCVSWAHWAAFSLSVGTDDQTVTQIDIYYVDKCECADRPNAQHMDQARMCAIFDGIYVLRFVFRLVIVYRLKYCPFALTESHIQLNMKLSHMNIENKKKPATIAR